MISRKIVEDNSGQAGIDYILGITIFFGGIITVFYIMANIISPISGESNELDYVAISLSEYLISNFSEGGLNVVNLGELTAFLSGDYESLKKQLVGERYEFNVTIEDLSGNVYASFGPEVPRTDTGFVKRLMVDRNNPDRLFLKVVVWR